MNLRTHDGVKDDTANVSRRMFHDGEDPTVDTCLLGKLNDSAWYGNATGVDFLPLCGCQ